MINRAFILLASTMLAAILLTADAHAQRPDSRSWNNSVREIEMLGGNVWMQAPFTTQQDGNFLFWPTRQNTRPSISVMFESTPATIQQFRVAALPFFAAAGIRIIRERILYGRIWEVESTSAAFRSRSYQRSFETDTGVVVVTATARANMWGHASTAQMIRTMQSLMVYY